MANQGNQQSQYSSGQPVNQGVRLLNTGYCEVLLEDRGLMDNEGTQMGENFYQEDRMEEGYP